MMVEADSAPVITHRVRVGQYDVQLWDEQDGLVVDHATGDRHALSWELHYSDECAALELYCPALSEGYHHRVCEALVDLVGADTWRL